MDKHKKAWEYSREIILNEVPFLERTGIVQWGEVIRDGQRDLWNMRYQWGGNVTESLMPLFMIAMLVQEYGNLGYDVTEAEQMLPEGLELFRIKNDIALYRHSVKLLHALYNAPKDPNHEYWKYPEYKTFDQYAAAVNFQEYPEFKITREALYEKVHTGWQAQVCAGAVGTAIEGYHTLQLEKKFGWVDRYLKEPEMYNDDLTFELTFLETFRRKGYDLTATDVAEDWAAYLPFAFTAEGFALRNIKMGMFPPESATFRNPYYELIGAMMRGAICGMVAPGNPKMAAKLAWEDASVSHFNNGVLGEIFNAVMVALAFVETDFKTILRKGIDLMPKDSKFYAVVQYAWEACEKYGKWRDAWLDCDEAFKQYGWIHTYPNAAAEVCALYFAGNDYDTLVSNIAMSGLDIDSTANQIACIPAIIYGPKCLSAKWTEPIGGHMETYVRGMEKVRFTAVAEKTVEAVEKAGGI